MKHFQQTGEEKLKVIDVLISQTVLIKNFRVPELSRQQKKCFVFRLLNKNCINILCLMLMWSLGVKTVIKEYLNKIGAIFGLKLYYVWSFYVSVVLALCFVFLLLLLLLCLIIWLHFQIPFDIWKSFDIKYLLIFKNWFVVFRNYFWREFRFDILCLDVRPFFVKDHIGFDVGIVRTTPLPLCWGVEPPLLPASHVSLLPALQNSAYHAFLSPAYAIA